MRDLTLSEQMLANIDDLDSENERNKSVEGTSTFDFDERHVSLIVDDLIKSRETFTSSKLAMIEQLVQSDRALFESLLDDRLTRDLLSEVSGYVARILSLSRLEGGGVPSETTNTYLREAVRTYVFGMPQASIALSRAALEQALKEQLGFQSTNTFVEMNKLLEEAEGGGVIDSFNRKVARDITNVANRVLHEEPADAARAYHILILLRGVLSYVYRTA